MASPANNVFLRLHKWASRQDENFLTESLAVVLEQLLELTPAAGTRLISRLTAGFVELPANAAKDVEIRTQISTEDGRPDVEIRTPDKCVWIEVKSESSVRAGQLEKYRRSLRQAKLPSRLILLSQYKEEYGPAAEKPDSECRWFQIATWLESEIPSFDGTEHGHRAKYVVTQFSEFLKARNMALDKVEKYLPEGLRAVANLMNLIAEAATSCGIKIAKPKWEDACIGVKLEGNNYWMGIHFASPDRLYFTTTDLILREPPTSKFDCRLGARGELISEIALDSEEVYFFSRSKSSQFDWLKNLIKERIAVVRQFAISPETSSQVNQNG